MNPIAPKSIVIQPLNKPEMDPVARSIAKPDAFTKFASFNNPKSVRVRPMGWKRGKGRPRKTLRDKRDVTFY